MSSFDRFSHLTKPAVLSLPALGDQPPAINTRYVIKSDGEESIHALSDKVETKIWFKSPPLIAHTIRMIRGIRLYTESHDQGFVDKEMDGNWTWFELAIFDNEQAPSPKKDHDGKEIVVVSHPNKVKSEQAEWLQGGTFDRDSKFLKSLEAGNVIAVRICACFSGWQIYADNGHLVVDIGDDNNPVPITPISINTMDPIPCRRNVKVWYEEAQTCIKTGLELSLFIRAMKAFQLLPPNDQLSYYRIAGIHGSPSVSWNMGRESIPLNDRTANDSHKQGKGDNYCHHNDYLFPTWHRAYMMLFERRVSDLMMEEAVTRGTRGNETKEWVNAAKRWRLPYWDWAVDPRLPDLARDENIKVIESWDGQGKPQMESLANPMYRFQMPGGKAMGDQCYGDYRIVNDEHGGVWELCIGTSHHAVTMEKEPKLWEQGVSNAAQVDQSLQGPHKEMLNLTLKDAIFRLLTYNYTTKYVRFASSKYYEDKAADGSGDSAKHYLNLEQIHNSVHNYIGDDTSGSLYGHMGSIPVAAFDPVFWLHHCNIDRLLHLWQCSNPGNWFNQQSEKVVDDYPQKDLIPFHSSDEAGKFYNSNMVRNVEALNYSYDYMDEFVDNFGDLIPAKSHIYINKLYGPPKRDFENAPSEGDLDPVINVIYDRYAFGGRSYSLLFFLGDVDKMVPYGKQKSLVGSIFTFSTVIKRDDRDVITCKNCYEQQRGKVLSRAQVPLTRVVPTGNRQGPEMAIDYLNENLKWIAIHQSGEARPELGVGYIQADAILEQHARGVQSPALATVEDEAMTYHSEELVFAVSLLVASVPKAPGASGVDS
ncbi:tyrosinase domain protein [Apiospora arundinis]|uniref:tyrosinase n=1 Tax=Apiospora arundinis TaxID=335852 RepID=A0ABR2J5A4_9PEZI